MTRRTFLLTSTALAAEAQLPDTDLPINWPEFLSRHDLHWKNLPASWEEGALLGNGLLGAMISATPDGALQWEMGHTAVIDHRDDLDPMMARPRLPIGRLLLIPAGKPKGGSARLDLYNAEASGAIETDRGALQWTSFIHANFPFLVIDLQTTGEERSAHFQWLPETVVNPRKLRRKMPLSEADLNPAPFIEERGPFRISVQQRTSGGEFAAAWQERNLSGDRRVLMFSIEDSFPGHDARLHAAIHLDIGAVTRIESLRTSHRKWWNGYYPASFLSIPDTRLESFYWIQMYKLACATRADRPAIDNQGPWFRTTPWPGIWWNLNIQLSYWPIYDSNRLELGESLLRLIDGNQQRLIENCPPEYRSDSMAVGRTSSYDARSPAADLNLPTIAGNPKVFELGNLTWALHNYWLHYRHVMDDAMLRDPLYPMLTRAINYYFHHLEEGPDGKLHLPEAISPEYPKTARDTNYDLSLLRWGCQTLLDSAKRLNLNDPLIPKWRDTLARLTPYPEGPEGFMIGKDTPLAVSHRHFSHLLMVYPLRLVTPEQPAQRDLIERSLRHWIGLPGALQGYSFVGASAISCCLGKGDDAAHFLNELIDRYVKSNTMYMESGPVIETPLAGAQAIHEMLLQSWGGIIRIFPAVPSSWSEASFRQLRAQGAFLVSAARRKGATRLIRIESLAGESCRIKTDLNPLRQAEGVRQFHIRIAAGGIAEIDLHKGETITLAAPGEPLGIMPVPSQLDRLNWFGQSRKNA